MCFYTKLVFPEMPVRHGEGKAGCWRINKLLEKLLTSENLDRFNLYKVSILSNQPWNILIIQNGSVGGIAGLTDPSGHILGFNATSGSLPSFW